MATVTNQIASPALRGQSVKVNLSSSDASKLAAITLGQKCTVSSSSNVGYVDSIDLYGNSFTMKPVTPALNVSSTTAGILATSETITLS